MSDTFIFDKVEVRTSGTAKRPRYIVRGYASIPNLPDVYKYTPDGRSFKSMFTSECIEDMKFQASHKKIFVDTEHEIASVINVRSALESIDQTAKESGLDITDAKKFIMDQVKMPELPFAKVNRMEVDDHGLFIEAELNDNLKNLSEDHQKYFTAVWDSLNRGFINGISLNFSPVELQEQEVNGQYVDVINKVDLYGLSFVGQPALANNSITEVAVRSMKRLKEGEIKMTEKTEQKIGDNQQDQIAEMQKQLDAARAEVDAYKQKEQEQKQAAVEAEKVQYQEQLQDIQQQMEALKKAQEESAPPVAKGVVSQRPQPIQQGLNSANEFKQNLNELSLGELIQLQHEFNTNQYRDPMAVQLLRQGKSDIVVNRAK